VDSSPAFFGPAWGATAHRLEGGRMFRLLARLLLLLIILGFVAYWFGYWDPFNRSPALPTATSEDLERARQKGSEAAKEVGQELKEAGKAIGEMVDDGTLGTKIKSKMALDDLVKAIDVNVDVKDGIVTLTGKVGSEKEKERALQLARETVGVKNVIDKLTVGS
jgi:hyperosmotically inducible periplasmic protein